MRDYDSNYGYADAVNRRARWGVVIVAILVLGFAWAGSALSGSEAPPSASVLSAEILGRSSVPIEVTVTADQTTTTTRPADSTTTMASEASSTTTLASTTTLRPPAVTTSTTRPAPPATTTSTTTTTTTVPVTTTTTTTTTVPPTTTTTTTVPPTTTTTIPPVVGTVHIHELKGDDKKNNTGLYAKIEVKIRNNEDDDQSGVLVTGTFSGAYVGTVTGTTNNKGVVVFESGAVEEDDSVTFTVTSLDHPDYAYAPEDNRRGPSVTVEFD